MFKESDSQSATHIFTTKKQMETSSFGHCGMSLVVVVVVCSFLRLNCFSLYSSVIPLPASYFVFYFYETFIVTESCWFCISCEMIVSIEYCTRLSFCVWLCCCATQCQCYNEFVNFLSTQELEKLASRKLHINAKETMKIAEKLYNKG